VGDLAAREKWNRRYAAPGFTAFPPSPAEWLVENGALLPGGGRALDLACGDGRNSRYLAERGFAVDALDVSDVAVEALRAAARAAGLDVRPEVVDLEAWEPPRERYDAIVNLNYLQRDLFGPLAAALRPGGVLVFETFSEAHVTELGNRFDPRFLLAPEELLGAFPTLLVRHYREGVAVRSGRPRGLASLVAQRPAAA
jgi:SAM-dependent methyltransferase